MRPFEAQTETGAEAEAEAGGAYRGRSAGCAAPAHAIDELDTGNGVGSAHTKTVRLTVSLEDASHGSAPAGTESYAQGHGHQYGYGNGHMTHGQHLPPPLPLPLPLGKYVSSDGDSPGLVLRSISEEVIMPHGQTVAR